MPAGRPGLQATIGVVAILGSTFDGSYEPVAEICAALDALQERTGVDVPVHVDGASGAMVAPFCDPDVEWDFGLPRVASINTSGHKYGLVYPGVGWAVWRDTAALPEELVFKVNYLGGEMPTFAFTVAEGSPFSVFDVSAGLREEGWLVPAYTFPANREDLAALRIVVRNGFSHDLADLLLEALGRVLERLGSQRGPHRGPESAAFSHGAERR